MRATRQPSDRLRLHYAAPETDADILYPTGFLAPDPVLFLALGRQRLLVVGKLERDRARRTSRVRRVLDWTEIAARFRQEPTIAAMIARLVRPHGLRSVVVPASFPLGLARELARHGVVSRPAHGPFWPDRERKRPDEIRAVQHSLRSAESGLRAAAEMLRSCRIGADGWLRREGRKFHAEDLRAAVNTAVLQAGCLPTRTICAGGDDAVDPHEEGRGPLRAHTPIVVDVSPRSPKTGYFGDITRTYVRGRASSAAQALHHAVVSAQRLAIAAICPGTQGQKIHLLVADHFKQAGFETSLENGRWQGFFHGTGHGIGLEIHEAPWLTPSRPSVLKSRQIVTVEPGLYYRGVGGVRLEDVVLVTPRGARKLSHLPDPFEI